ncbi:MAG: DUF350 domain-containing protein [Deltaproteobacteria bacterium]|nr:DUF350 domain-containing protein [Deltaproteobacteria bacterium]
MRSTLHRALFVGVVSMLVAAPTFAQTPEPGTFDGLLRGVIGTVVYGVLGILLAVLGQKVFEWTTPFSVRKELEEDHNTAVGMVMAAMTLGISIIIAATILS